MTTALVNEIILPNPGDRNVHGNASFEPQYLRRSINRAYNQKAGLAFMHSHPCRGWQGMSDDDVVAERDVISRRAKTLSLPVVGMTIGTDESWSARFWEWENGIPEIRECERVNVVGGHMNVTFHPTLVPPYKFRDEFRRTVSAWGQPAQRILGRVRFGVVGLGSVGCLVAESLARMGVQHITLIDPDKIEPHNLDRLIYATSDNCDEFKVNFFAERLKNSATAKKEHVVVHPVPYGVDEAAGFKAALDCDILFGCVDSECGRLALNHIAYAHMIPVFEGGIQSDPRDDRRIRRPHWRTHAVYPGVRCLRCYKQYSSAGLSAERDGKGKNPTYMGEWEGTKPNQNVFAFSANLASMQILQMLRSIVAPHWDVIRHTHFKFKAHELDCQRDSPHCESGCKFPLLEGQGDNGTAHLI